MSIYSELLQRIWRGYRDAGNGFHPPDAQKKIDDAFGGFDPPFGVLAAAIQKRRDGLFPDRNAYATTSRDALRMIDAQLAVLDAAIGAAARADNVKIGRIIVDQPVAVRKAKAQQAADRDMRDKVDRLVRQAHEDALSAEA